MHSTMKLLSLLAPAAVLGEGVLFNFYQKEQCTGDIMNWGLGEPSDNTCQQGSMIPDDSWEFDEEKHYTAYVQAENLPEGCKIALLRISENESNRCGNPIGIWSRSGDCRKLKMDSNMGTKYCCGEEQCAKLGLSDRKARSAPLPAPPVDGTAPRDVTAAKRAAPLAKRKDECKFAGNKVTTQRSKDQIKLISVSPCETEGGCTQKSEAKVGFSFTETFGISSTIGAGFMDIVQASVTFSYEYSYTQSEERSVGYDVTVGYKESGFIGYVQLYECTTGKFTGCKDWDNDRENTVCIPKVLPGGVPEGEINFVRTD